MRQAHPRRIDWARVAAIIVLILSAVVAVIGIGASLVYFLTAF